MKFNTQFPCAPTRWLCAFFCLLTAAGVRADLVVGSPFNDHMVLQRDRKVPVWGWATPNEKVTVAFAGQKISVVAGKDGAWRVDLKPLSASVESRTLTVSGASRSVQAFKDVLVGEVWWCSGQSNMALTLWGAPRLANGANREINGMLEAAMANEPLVRGATVPNSWDAEPQKTGERLKWVAFKGGDLRSFSAISYYYALALYRALQVPVGVVCSAWGGTVIQPWISSEGFDSVPVVAKVGRVKILPRLEKMGSVDAAALPEAKKKSLHQQPTVLYNAMVAPYAPYAIRGVIWYQGESNITGPEPYVDYMKALYATYEKSFEHQDVPLEFVQIAPFHYDWLDKKYDAQTMGRFWESQARFAAEEKNAHMAIICDVGEKDNIHPVEKRTVALRLAALALHHTYGQANIPCESPVLRSHRLEKGVFTLEFDHVSAWYYRSKQPMRFEVAGADGKFVQAKVEVRGATICVSAPSVAAPCHLRYLWNWDWPGYLTNESGLPLGGFRIDEPTTAE